MRIAMIGQKGMPGIFGGVERHVDDLSCRLVESGIDVTVYARPWYTRGKYRTYKGVNILRPPSLRTKHLDTISHTLFATVHAIMRDFDIIHYHGVGPALWAWLPRLFSPKTTVIVTFHSIDRKHAKWGFLARFILRIGEWCAARFPHQTIAVSHTIEQYLRDVYDCTAVYIPNSVQVFSPIETAKELRAWGLKRGEYVLFVSRLIAHKGAHYLIDAWKLLQKTAPKIIRGKKLVIVGGGHYTSQYVKTLRQSASTDESIVLTGFQTGTPLVELFTHAALFVHPSDNEGMPLNVLEAMSYSLPTILSNIPEHKDLSLGEGFLFSRGRPASLAQAIERVLSLSEETRTAAGAKNRQRIISEFNADRVIHDTLALYESCHLAHRARLAPALR